VTALAFDARGNLFAERGDSILKIASNGSIATFATGNFHTSSLAFDAAGNLFAGLNAYSASEPAIVKFSLAGAATTFVSGPLSPAGLAFEPVTEKLRNLSARGLVSNTQNAQLIGGFIVGGSALANNAVVARALGPSLTAGGVSNPLADPVLELHDSSGAIVAVNNNWQDAHSTQITASGLAPADPLESAIYATLPTGNYTAVVRSGDQATGIAVVEVYSVTH
jgi:hypothetical protein